MESLSLYYLYNPSGILIYLDFVLPDGSLSVHFDPGRGKEHNPH